MVSIFSDMADHRLGVNADLVEWTNVCWMCKGTTWAVKVKWDDVTLADSFVMIHELFIVDNELANYPLVLTAETVVTMQCINNAWIQGEVMGLTAHP
jgi:hypothetical protein